jgi:hypothetical protein
VYRFKQVTRLTTPAVLAAVAEEYQGRPFAIAADGELTYSLMAAQAAGLDRPRQRAAARAGPSGRK